MRLPIPPLSNTPPFNRCMESHNHVMPTQMITPISLELLHQIVSASSGVEALSQKQGNFIRSSIPIPHVVDRTKSLTDCDRGR